MRILWLMPPSQIPGEYPLVSQNRWFKYLPTRANFIYPVIAAYGVSMLLKDGFDVEFIDAPAEDRNLQQIMAAISKYDLVILEGRTAVMPWLWQLLRFFKEIKPDLKVVVYGDHVMVRPREALQHGFDHVVCCGDYDLGVYQLVKALDSGDHVPAIFRYPLMENLDDLPPISRTAVNWRNYYESWRHREEFGWIQSGRGCFASCSFCSWNYTFYGKTIRTMSSRAVFERVKFAHATYGVREILDDADTFLMSYLGKPLARELLNEQMDIYWNIQTRADQILTVSQAELEMMKKSGLHVVKLGVDGSNDETLRRIQKGITVHQIRKAVSMLKKAGLEVHVNMILGYPWENKKTAYDCIKFVKSLKPNQAQFGLIQPFIGTPLYSEAVENGWFIRDPDDYGSWDMKEPLLAWAMGSREISKLYKDAWSSFYFSPDYLFKQFWKAMKLSIEHRNLEAFQHLWRGFRAVYYGHMRAVEQ
jgi:anaerobic magnesium-protoporphyrin IX monomethyl ester cyclase